MSAGNTYKWPNPIAVKDRLAQFMAAQGEKLELSSENDLIAGFERAQTVSQYETDASAAKLAALMFEGIAARRPLMDGNKRLAMLAALTFLMMNGIYLDVSERELFEISYDIVGKNRPLEDLISLFEANGRPEIEC